MLPASALVAVGCHRETTRAYSQPPPPASSSASNAHSKKNTHPVHLGSGSDPDVATASPGTAKTAPAPVVPPDPHGKPVSVQIGMASWYGPPYAGRKGA